FEGAGVVSTWKLELPTNFRQFDYDTISDVILHVRYTARQGGEPLRGEAIKHLESQVKKANESGLALLFSLKHDFPSEWHRFVTGGPGTSFVAQVKREYFPYFTQGRKITIKGIQIHAIEANKLDTATPGGLNLTKMTAKLKNERAFELSLAPDGAVLVRQPEANIFVLIRYSLQPA
ncbi:MAG: toxin, partial [Chloroflexota bacterium]|nr:toxin [Chloroflexota bacterium]